MQIVNRFDKSAYIDHELSKKQSGNKLAVARSRREYDLRLFQRRFTKYSSFIGEDVICLGARLGTEVLALRSIGRPKAFGIDIGDYEGAEHVIHGDFMNMQYSDRSFDFSYTNCFDHTYDPLAFIREVARVMRPGGFSLFDVMGNINGKWDGYDIWHPDDLDEVGRMIGDCGHQVVGFERIRRPYPGRSILVKWWEPVTPEQRARYRALQSVSDRLFEIYGVWHERRSGSVARESPPGGADDAVAATEMIVRPAASDRG